MQERVADESAPGGQVDRRCGIGGAHFEYGTRRQLGKTELEIDDEVAATEVARVVDRVGGRWCVQRGVERDVEGALGGQGVGFVKQARRTIRVAEAFVGAGGEPRVEKAVPPHDPLPRTFAELPGGFAVFASGARGTTRRVPAAEQDRHDGFVATQRLVADAAWSPGEWAHTFHQGRRALGARS